jgi:hypothetical protein
LTQIRPIAGGGVPAGVVDTPDAKQETPIAPDHTAANLATSGADPAGKFNALFGAPPNVKSFYADSNGPSGGSTKAPPKPPVYDVRNVTEKQIEDLRAKGQTRLANTIHNAQVAYHDLLDANPKVKIVVTTSAGNGGHPVLVVMGPEANKGAHVNTHYHGDNATVADPLGSKAGTNARIRDVILKEDKQAVFVLPEARNSTAETDSPRNDNGYRAHWGDVTSQVQTTKDALDAVGIADKDVKERVVSFHSGGGMALIHLMRKDPKGSLLQADRLDLHDCVYHFNNGVDKNGKPNPTLDFEKYMRDFGKTANGKAVKQVVFYRGSNNDVDAKMNTMRESFSEKGRLRKIDVNDLKPVVGKDGRIDESVNPVASDVNGNGFEGVRLDNKGRQIGKAWLAHNYNNDPHYRTTGQFLGAKPPK